MHFAHSFTGHHVLKPFDKMQTNFDDSRTRRQVIVKPSSSGDVMLAAIGLEQWPQAWEEESD